MTNKMLAVFACLSLAAQAGAQVNFDKGINIKDAVEQAKSSEVKVQYPNQGSHRIRYSKDCKNFSYGASDYGLSSQRVYLESAEYIEECRFVAKPPPPPPNNNNNNGGHNNGGNNNNNGGHNNGGNNNGGHNNGGHGPKSDVGVSKGDPWNQSGYQPGHEYSYDGNVNGKPGTWYCRERVGQVFRTSAQMQLAPRTLFPWESESFQVCMEGQRVDFDVRQSPYSYSVDRTGMFDLTFNLTPRYRTATPPDADGLYSSAFFFQDGKFHLKINDRWAQYYAGEKTLIKVELMKDGFLFFNSSKGEKEFTLDASGGYEVVFAENELTKNKSADEELDNVERMDRGAKKYFVKWGFRRLGSVSTDSYIGKGSTDKIPAN